MLSVGGIMAKHENCSLGAWFCVTEKATKSTGPSLIIWAPRQGARDTVLWAGGSCLA